MDIRRVMAMSEGALSILRNYDTPPEGGTLVPRAWVEEHLDELREAAAPAAEVEAEVERQLLGDVSNWKPEGLTGMSGILGIDTGSG